MSADQRHRVVVIGSGFGGLTAAKALKSAPVDVTMIARTQHHLFMYNASGHGAWEGRALGFGS